MPLEARFVTGEPALYIVGEGVRGSSRSPNSSQNSWLCIADIHLGVTRELAEAGITLPDQVDKFVSRILSLKRKTRAKNLILLGDVKHKVTGVNLTEMREIPEFLEQLSKKFDKIVIVKGNHDGNIEKIIPPHLHEKVAVKKNFALADFLFTHGHRAVKTKASSIVVGHNQPAVLFRDAVGARYIEPCWVRGPLTGKLKGKDLVIIPAFNDVRGHGLVNKDKLIGPIASHLDRKAAHAYLMDGTDLGTLADLEVE